MEKMGEMRFLLSHLVRLRGLLLFCRGCPSSFLSVKFLELSNIFNNLLFGGMSMPLTIRRDSARLVLVK
jgi:hypothetical protein